MLILIKNLYECRFLVIKSHKVESDMGLGNTLLLHCNKNTTVN